MWPCMIERCHDKHVTIVKLREIPLFLHDVMNPSLLLSNIVGTCECVCKCSNFVSIIYGVYKFRTKYLKHKDSFGTCENLSNLFSLKF